MRVFTDTTEFFSIDYGDIIQIGDKRYSVIGHERERRFGIDDPKFWVKRAVDTDTGEKKIIKLSFFESFETKFGPIKIRCFRDPNKEAMILDLVRDHPYFMHGTSCKDEKENIIRVLNIVPGPNFFRYIDALDMGYESYLDTVLPDILKKLVRAFESIRFLHINGFRHGDIRNDHIIVDRETGNYVWIDFDYDYEAGENPFGLDVFGLGNILIYTIGKGFHTARDILADTLTYGDLKDRLELRDFSILHERRFINLRKLYPDIPKSMNDILMHFSCETDVYYEYVEEIIEDLNRSILSLS
ncbi:MAG: protein kinase [Deltaproteobacteria bacterium]|nr:protein kinase [Deltaproteobacteria bacterium]